MQLEEMNQVDMADVETATSISLCLCHEPSCGPHLILWRGDKAFAHAPMSVEMAQEVIKDLQECIEYKTGTRQ